MRFHWGCARKNGRERRHLHIILEQDLGVVMVRGLTEG
jgi:hypothetical protein